jgi:hypothetical protein
MSARCTTACAAILIATTALASPGQRARLRGQIFDSVAVAPLAGARVELVSASDRARILFSVVSDSLGRFVLDSVAQGKYIAGFVHPMLDSLGLAFAQRLVEVTATGDVKFDLAVPSPARLELELCGIPSDRTADGVILGYVLNSHTLGPTDSATVIAQWDEISLGNGGVHRTVVTRLGHSDGAGWFSLCGLPTATSVALRAAIGADTSGPIEVEVPKTLVARRNVYVDHQTFATTVSRVAPAADTAISVVHGWVRTEDGVPIPGAQVAIFGAAPLAVTDAEGEFRLDGVPAGTQTLVTRAIGFLPDERAVDLTDRHIPVIIGLTSLRQFLDTMHVRASRVSLTSSVGFDDRRRLGSGRFFTPEEIERMHARELTDVLRRAPTLELRTDNSHNVTIRMRGDMDSCTPAIFIDGKQFIDWSLADLNGIVQPDQIAGLEIYTPSMTPVEFRTKQGCGTIVVWTHASERRDSRH